MRGHALRAQAAILYGAPKMSYSIWPYKKLFPWGLTSLRRLANVEMLSVTSCAER